MPEDTATTAPPTATDGTQITPAPPMTNEELAQQLDHWRTHAREQEKRAKENASAAKELQQVRQQSMTDTEKAVAEAKVAGRAEAEAGFAQRLAAAEIRAALAGLIDDPQSVVDDLNLSKYVTDDGQVDAKAVAALRERFAGLIGNRRPATPDLGQGNRGIAAPANGGDFLRNMREDLRGRKSR